MKGIFKAAVLGTATVVLFSLVSVSTAAAQCALPGWNLTSGTGSQEGSGVRKLASGYVVLASNGEGPGGRIVGFWKVKFVSEGTSGIPDGTVIDNGFAQWHSDGTEIMNSSRVPATGNFCLGIFQKSGPSSFDLNHFGLSFDPSGTFVGPARIQEHVSVNAKADEYEGAFTIDQYDPTGTLLVHISGKVTATRIDVDTPVADVL